MGQKMVTHVQPNFRARAACSNTFIQADVETNRLQRPCILPAAVLSKGDWQVHRVLFSRSVRVWGGGATKFGAVSASTRAAPAVPRKQRRWHCDFAVSRATEEAVQLSTSGLS